MRLSFLLCWCLSLGSLPAFAGTAWNGQETVVSVVSPENCTTSEGGRLFRCQPVSESIGFEFVSSIERVTSIEIEREGDCRTAYPLWLTFDNGAGGREHQVLRGGSLQFLFLGRLTIEGSDTWSEISHYPASCRVRAVIQHGSIPFSRDEAGVRSFHLEISGEVDRRFRLLGLMEYIYQQQEQISWLSSLLDLERIEVVPVETIDFLVRLSGDSRMTATEAAALSRLLRQLREVGGDRLSVTREDRTRIQRMLENRYEAETIRQDLVDLRADQTRTCRELNQVRLDLELDQINLSPFPSCAEESPTEVERI